MKRIVQNETVTLEIVKDFSDSDPNIVFREYLFDDDNQCGNIYLNYASIGIGGEKSIKQTPYRSASALTLEEDTVNGNTVYQIIIQASDQYGNMLAAESVYAPKIVVGSDYVLDNTVFDMVLSGYLQLWKKSLNNRN